MKLNKFTDLKYFSQTGFQQVSFAGLNIHNTYTLSKLHYKCYNLEVVTIDLSFNATVTKIYIGFINAHLDIFVPLINYLQKIFPALVYSRKTGWKLCINKYSNKT